ncbi:class I SAM-dependent methyltransferase [Kamptonema formosum]|uniref:class I SAM-dependent methyltransferase n=1 Tax=Kamptonema formosum TaxID=331992 RepID=UPI0003485CA0|nr:class I SAM-dependent methyltransferase [Oscillatoria sp. PCC 10802]
MAAAANMTSRLASQVVNRILSIKPLAKLAKSQARNMMIERAERIGVHWRQEAQALRERDLEAQLAKVLNPQLIYPEYYVCSFHAYEKGNLSWEAATEVEVAAHAVHATIWPNAGAQGDAMLRKSYHDILNASLPVAPRDIADLGCSVGMSTFALQEVYPDAKLTGVDLSPYFLAIANLRSQERNADITWRHAPAESTGLPAASFDLVSIFLMCHELPQAATREIFREARRLLRPNGHIAIMDMNPKADAYMKMPPYILTLLKSTEPYIDEYFTLDMEEALVGAGFEKPVITPNSRRHRTIIAKVN